MLFDCDYFREHIEEELHGAKEYAKAAMEAKASNATWAKQFVDMANQELIHAKNFYEMFLEYYEKAVKPYTEIPKYFRDKKTEIIDKYSECYSEVKYLLEMVSK